ncbi:transcription regulator [Rhodococcus sp. B7740]|uniref:helix-turn-helix transcriptional regulator n=1 Tax=Rhodococcus sp. B7740 TaxID=1564114 RepID=UPI0005DA515F|nr:LuxR C-terminal-related transcriptional regulator [Rhodococcus sp. B7740]AJW41644.1 transcription regulator [Rhodococcus sp. B7740]
MVLIDHRPKAQTRVAVPRTVRNPLGPRPPVARSTHATAQVQSPRPAQTYASAGLTEREVAVLKVWLNCDSKVEVGARLHIALGTVNTHLTRIRDKYSRVGRAAPTKAALVARALQDGIVKLDDL